MPRRITFVASSPLQYPRCITPGASPLPSPPPETWPLLWAHLLSMTSKGSSFCSTDISFNPAIAHWYLSSATSNLSSLDSSLSATRCSATSSSCWPMLTSQQLVQDWPSLSRPQLLYTRHFHFHWRQSEYRVLQIYAVTHMCHRKYSFVFYIDAPTGLFCKYMQWHTCVTHGSGSGTNVTGEHLWRFFVTGPHLWRLKVSQVRTLTALGVTGAYLWHGLLHMLWFYTVIYWRFFYRRWTTVWKIHSF